MPALPERDRTASESMDCLLMATANAVTDLLPDLIAELVEPMDAVLTTWGDLTQACSAWLETQTSVDLKEMHRALSTFAASWTQVTGSEPLQAPERL